MELMESHSITLSVTSGHPPNIQHSNRLFIEFDMFRILDTRCRQSDKQQTCVNRGKSPTLKNLKSRIKIKAGMRKIPNHDRKIENVIKQKIAYL